MGLIPCQLDDLSNNPNYTDTQKERLSYDIKKFVVPMNTNHFGGEVLDDFLMVAIEQKASDVYFKTNGLIYMSVHGRNYDLSSRPLSPAEMESCITRLYGNSDAGLNVLASGEAVDISYTLRRDNVQRVFRVNITRLYTRNTPIYSCVMRLLPTKPQSLNYNEVGRDMLDTIRYPSGFILICGATGSGKSTLLDGFCLDLIYDKAVSKNIILLGSPLETMFDKIPQLQTKVNQIEVGLGGIESFRAAMRNAMRQAPTDIIVGEIRDQETMNAATQGMVSGHLMYGTLHADTVALMLKRIAGFYTGIEQRTVLTDVITSTRLAVAQRLVDTLDGKRCALREYLVFNHEIVEELTNNLENAHEKLAEFVFKYGVHFAVHARQRVLEGSIAPHWIKKVSAGYDFPLDMLDNRIRELKAAGNPAFQNNDL